MMIASALTLDSKIAILGTKLIIIKRLKMSTFPKLFQWRKLVTFKSKGHLLLKITDGSLI